MHGGIGVLTLTPNEKQCKFPNTVYYSKEIDQSASSIRVELMIKACISYTHAVNPAWPWATHGIARGSRSSGKAYRDFSVIILRRLKRP